MRSKLLSMVVGAAAISAAVLVSQVPGVAQAAPLAPLAPAAGTAIPTATGGSNTLFGLTLPVNANCPDTGTVGYRLHGFIAPISVDVASLTWTGLGAPVGNALAKNLYDQGGTGVRNLFPVGAPVVGAISGIPGDIQLSAGGVFGPGSYAPGVYQIGVACAFADAGGVNRTEKFYASRITISTDTTASGGGAQVNFANGSVPPPPTPAPTAVAGTPGSGTVTVTFSSVTATPAVIDYNVILTPKAGLGTLKTTPLVTSSPATITGVVPGDYNVTVAARNSAGLGAASAPGEVLVAAAAVTGVGNGTNTANGDTYVKIATPTEFSASGFTTGATVTIQFRSLPLTIGTVVDNQTPAVGTNLLDLDPAAGAVRVAVTIPLVDGDGVASNLNRHQLVFIGTDGRIAVLNIQPQSLTLTDPPLTQTVIVNVPVGVITFQQKCGTFGAFAARTGTGAPVTPVTIPGLPAGWGTNSAGVGENDLPFSIPTVAAPLGPLAPPSPFINYDAITATTPRGIGTCQIRMSDPTLVTDSVDALNGSYYTAFGSLNQVTVIDSRDTDSGWRAFGKLLGDFTRNVGTPADTFSGNYLGWYPQVTKTSATTPEGYTQTVVPGDPVNPGQGIAGSTSGGIKTASILAATPPTVLGKGGLGRADLDARMAMYIPLTDSDPGIYTATLELTLLPL